MTVGGEHGAAALPAVASLTPGAKPPVRSLAFDAARRAPLAAAAAAPGVVERWGAGL